MTDIDHIDIIEFNKVATKLRDFFRTKNFIEIPSHLPLSILSACEDPSTITTTMIQNQVWPNKQTMQLEMEKYLMKNPTLEGMYCISASFRDEPNPTIGRHNRIFQLCDVEMRRDYNGMIEFWMDLLEYLGFGNRNTYKRFDYEDLCKRFNTDLLEHEHEERLYREEGSVVFIEKFPRRSSPFFNMRMDDKCEYAYKCDVIICGQETFGTAQRSSDKKQMRDMFHTISDGEYAEKLYSLFGKERVDKELDDFLSLDMITRSGGGIGINRLIRAMKLQGLL